MSQVESQQNERDESNPWSNFLFSLNQTASKISLEKKYL